MRSRADSAGLPAPNGTTTVSGLSAAAFPYDAGQYVSQDMGDWQPIVRSPDGEINWNRDRMVARSRDLVRNSGWASGAIGRILDNTIGTHLRLRSRPDHAALASRFGIKAFDATWAEEFRKAVEARWRGFAHHPQRWSDVSRQLTLGQQLRVAMRHKLIDGESLLLCHWLPDRVGFGGADYSTAFMLIDPDRLSNPNGIMDSKTMRGGVEIDANGVARAYHIRQAEQNDWYNAIEAQRWERVPREDPDGWRRVIHDFDSDRANQHRGVGIFTSVLGHMKMLAKYYGVELQQAVLASIFGTYVESPFDPAIVQDAMGGGDDGISDGISLPAYQDMRADWHNQKPLYLNGVQVPLLAPGEKINSVASAHPHTNFGAFAHEMLCVFAAASGLSIEQVTADWSKSNYSSARAASAETWKSLMRRRGDFADNTATPAYAVWLAEPMDLNELPLPHGAPEYLEAMAEYCRCTWLGPAKGYVDPTKEPAGAILRLEAGVSTLDMEASEQGGDWEEIVEQRALEQARYLELDVPMPAWANTMAITSDSGGDETIGENAAGAKKQ